MFPSAGSQASNVHALLSSTSLTTWVTAPVAVLQASTVHLLPSSVIISV